MTANWTTSEACERMPGVTARLIYSWRDRGRITPSGRIGRESLWPAAGLLKLEAATHNLRARQDGRIRVNVATSACVSMPGQPRQSAGLLPFPGVTMPPDTDLVPLAEGQMTIPLPSGQRLRIDIAVMPDLTPVAHVELLEAVTLRAS